MSFFGWVYSHSRIALAPVFDGEPALFEQAETFNPRNKFFWRHALQAAHADRGFAAKLERFRLLKFPALLPFQAYAYKKGELTDASPAVKALAATMSLQQLKDFAATKHEELPGKKAAVETIDNPESAAHGHEVDTSPSEARKESENYRKAHIRLDGMAVGIENPLGSFRRGTAPDGTAWESEMHADYGYFKGTKGYDHCPGDLPGKDAVDVFIKPGYQGGAGVVYIVNQVCPDTGAFDEHKCVLGASSADEAQQIYLSNYDKGWKGCESVVARSMEDFKSWVYSNGPKKGALAPYRGWVGVDLDATLAKYDGWRGKLHIGEPVPGMVRRVKNWLEAGRDIRIFTARAHNMSTRAKNTIEQWCSQHVGRILPITCTKDPECAEIWDDRAVSVLANRGCVTKAAGFDEPVLKHAAAGIPDRQDLGDLSKLPVGRLLPLLIQLHKAEKAGEHRDIRLGTPDTGYYSWATRKEMPGPGEKRRWFRQPLHSREGAEFEGEIPEGYGKGLVSMLERGEAMVLSASPDEVDLVLAHKRHPEYLKLVKQDGDWLAVNHTPLDPAKFLGSETAYEKPHYKEIPFRLPDNPEGYVGQAKISGASGVLRFGPKGVDILSYRRSKVDGRPIIHTQRVLGGSKIKVPPGLEGTLARGEIYGERDGKAIDEQQVSGILNSSLANALHSQERDGTRLKVALFDLIDGGGDYAAKRKVLEQLAELDDHFTLPDTAETPEAMQAMLDRIASGEHPQTEEGVVYWPRDGGAPLKAKIKQDADVYMREFFPGEGFGRKLLQAVIDTFPGSDLYLHAQPYEFKDGVVTDIDEPERKTSLVKLYNSHGFVKFLERHNYMVRRAYAVKSADGRDLDSRAVEGEPHYLTIDECLEYSNKALEAKRAETGREWTADELLAEHIAEQEKWYPDVPQA